MYLEECYYCVLKTVVTQRILFLGLMGSYPLILIRAQDLVVLAYRAYQNVVSEDRLQI